MAGIIDDGDIGVTSGIQEFAHRALEFDDADVASFVHDVETRLGEQRRNRMGVIDRVDQGAGVLVFGVADDERDAPVGPGGVRGERRDDKHADGKRGMTNEPDHVLIPMRRRRACISLSILADYGLKG